ncbi:flagellar filament capping protein FliD [Bryobacter aggregatus]|uniref:flagellar filament capping protein FliD n=1 Tax=Bryobacter aggregatus TaxID=360054 RepID=UPI0004E1DB1B|nr:flagellar filament capping protein FliD [Bryobacter aggregatus]
MSLTPLTFSGISEYSADFQTILTRITNIASYPLNQLKNEQIDVASRRQLTNELNASMMLFGQKLSALKEVAGNRAIAASTSNAAKVSIDTVNSDTATTYTLSNITSLARAASETSKLAYANSGATPVSASGNLQLSVGDTNYSFTLGNDQNNLVGLRDKINSLGAGVTASILTVSGTENYLSISANSPGAKTLTLTEDPEGANTNLLTQANQGSDLNFVLNGVAVSRKTNQVNDLIPGVSFSVKDTSAAGESITLRLGTDRSKLSAAIADFADAYNALQSKVGAQIGQSAGLLSGDFLVREASEILRRISSFSIASGTVKNWSDLGVRFDSTGTISFDTSTFQALSDSSISDAFSFFKDTTGLGALTSRTDSFTDAVKGLAKMQLDQYDKTDTRLNSQISAMEDRVRLLTTSYQAKLQAADALLGNLASQKNIVSASIQSLNLVLYGKNQG